MPLLRCKDSEMGIDIDVNINNSLSILNTHLLYSYTRICRKFAALAMIAKLWAKHNKIIDAQHNALSSYSVVLWLSTTYMAANQQCCRRYKNYSQISTDQTQTSEDWISQKSLPTLCRKIKPRSSPTKFESSLAANLH